MSDHSESSHRSEELLAAMQLDLHTPFIETAEGVIPPVLAVLVPQDFQDFELPPFVD